MFVAIENIVDEAVDDGRLPDCLVTEKDYLVFEQWRDRSLRQI